MDQNSISSLVFILIMFAVFFFLMILPQRKQRKQREEFLKSLKAGDKVITNSGIFGEVFAVENDEVVLIIAKDTKIRILLDGILRQQKESSNR